MSWSGAEARTASPLAMLVDETREGSPFGQVLTGVVGLVLAAILVMGQISLATTKGIAHHLHGSIDHITEGNQVMLSVIERAAPSRELPTVVGGQARVLANTRSTMVELNEQMAGISATTNRLEGIVADMESTSSTLASGVDGMAGDTDRIVSLLGGLPDATERTHTQLGTIGADTAAINTELEAIGTKMDGYGLPRAKNVGADR